MVEQRIDRLRGFFEAGRNIHFVALAADEVVGELTLTLNDPGVAAFRALRYAGHKSPLLASGMAK